jgi:hypothetical protein
MLGPNLNTQESIPILGDRSTLFQKKKKKKKKTSNIYIMLIINDDEREQQPLSKQN